MAGLLSRRRPRPTPKESGSTHPAPLRALSNRREQVLSQAAEIAGFRLVAVLHLGLQMLQLTLQVASATG